jgi:CubicO group peptidase (beta-lactamase class C family)
MKISKSLLIFIVPAIILTAVSFLFYPSVKGDRSSETGQIQTDNEEIFPQSINKLLSNDNSNLPQTEKLDRQIENFLRTWRIKGASIAVMKDEKLIYAKGYGWADEEKKIKTDVKHIFRIASVSKLITATAIMKLVEKGEIRLSSKVFGDGGILNSADFSDIRDQRIKNITIENLLRHQAGFTRRYGDPMFSTLEISRRLGIDTIPSKEQIIAFSITKKLGYTPGEGTRYSNLGYLILSEVIEKITGMPYEQYIRDSILIPAGCYDMHLAKNSYTKKYTNEVKYYEPQDQEMVESFDGSGNMVSKCYGGSNIEGLFGAGGWVASPTELLKFVASIDDHPVIKDILSHESICKMTDSGPGRLPIGWAKTYQHGDWVRTGTLSGTSAMLRHQTDGYTWVFVTNTSSWKGSDFPKLIDGFFKKEIKKVSIWPNRDLFELARELTGIDKFTPGKDHRLKGGE